MIKFLVDVFDTNNLWILPNLDLSTDSYKKVIEWSKGFKERKWKVYDDRKGFAVPNTDESLSYLRSEYIEGKDYTVTDNARMLLAYLDISKVVFEAKAEKRWEYLFNGAGTDFNYPSPLPPMMHQRIGVEAALGLDSFAYFQEMGTGKSKEVVDEVLNYELAHSEPQRILIVCPKSLRYNWVDEIRLNIPSVFAYTVHLLNDPETLIDIIQAPQHIKFLVATYDGVVSYLDALCIFQPTLAVMDESQLIKNPKAQRTKAALALREHCKRRRLLTGTYCANTMLDLWSQCEFLRPGILGYGSMQGFKTAFAKVRHIIDPITGQPTPFDKITGYKDVDKLKEAMSRFAFIVKKEQCLDLPSQTWQTVVVEMKPKHREQYAMFCENMLLELDGGLKAHTEFRLVFDLRCSQMCGGFIGATHEENEIVTKKVVGIEDGDAKAVALVEDLVQTTVECKVIVWARWNYEIDLLARMMTDAGINYVIYDGRVNEEDREFRKKEFNRNPKVRVFLGKASTGGVGLNLIGDQSSQYTSCTAMYFYSNSQKFDHRDQAEARNHRKGSTRPVIYKDFIYKDSYDEDTLSDLKRKKDVQVMMKSLESIRDILLKGAKHG